MDVALKTVVLPYDGDSLYWLRYLRESIGFNLCPLHHILLMRFFAGTVENFFNIEVKAELPYGSDPWSCANKLCGYYRKDGAIWIHARLVHEFDKPRWNEWGEAALAELKAVYTKIQSSGDKRK